MKHQMEDDGINLESFTPFTYLKIGSGLKLESSALSAEPCSMPPIKIFLTREQPKT